MPPCGIPVSAISILSSAFVQLVGFVIYIFIIPALTAYTPIPQSFEDSVSRTISMILSPISSCIFAFNALVMLAIKIAKGNSTLCGVGSRTALHDAISAGAIAIGIPIRFISVVDQDPFAWRKLNQNVPTVDTRYFPRSNSSDHDSSEETMLYSVPWNCRFRTTPTLTLYPASSILKSAIAILQLVYSSFVAYMQYEPLIKCQGLLSPFLIAVSHLYMSCVNLMANLGQGSYVQVMVIPPAVLGANAIRAHPSNTISPQIGAVRPPPRALLLGWSHRSDSILPLSPSAGEARLQSTSSSFSSPNLYRCIQGAVPNDLVRELDTWLATNFPQIEFPKHRSSISAIAFFAHHSLSLIVMFVWVAILTGFKARKSSSQILLFLTIIADPFLHCALALAQRTSHCWGSRRIDAVVHSGGAIVAVKFIVWMVNMIGCQVALKSLAGIYRGCC